MGKRAAIGKAIAKPGDKRAEILLAGEENPARLVLARPEGADSLAMARGMDAMEGVTDNASTAWAWSKLTRVGRDDLPITHCAEALRQEIAKVQAGDLSQVEAMLFGQATALAGVFHACMERARQNMGQHLDATETYMRLALKAQSQSRTTLEALIEAKNPRSVAFVKQANIANGHQQVNNAREQTESPPNELQGDFNVVDPGTQTARLGVDAPASPMAHVNRPANGRRKAKNQAKRVERRSAANAARPRRRT